MLLSLWDAATLRVDAETAADAASGSFAPLPSFEMGDGSRDEYLREKMRAGASWRRLCPVTGGSLRER